MPDIDDALARIDALAARFIDPELNPYIVYAQAIGEMPAEEVVAAAILAELDIVRGRPSP